MFSRTKTPFLTLKIWIVILATWRKGKSNLNVDGRFLHRVFIWMKSYIQWQKNARDSINVIRHSSLFLWKLSHSSWRVRSVCLRKCMPKTSYRIVPGILQVFGKESTVDWFTLWKDNNILMGCNVFVFI